MLNKKEMQARIPFIQEWLNERWFIIEMEEPPRPADLAYYDGAIKALVLMGFGWSRNGDGKHTIY